MSGDIEQRVSLITLGVKDLKAARDFYVDFLGWTPAAENPAIIFFDMGGYMFSLYPHEAAAKEIGETPTDALDATYRGVMLAHNVRTREEVDAILARVGQAGQKILKQPEETFWGGYSGKFADPDGHVWEIGFNPHWTIDDNGRVALAERH